MASAWFVDTTANVNTNSHNDNGTRAEDHSSLLNNSLNRYDFSSRDYSDHNSHNSMNYDYDYNYEDSRNLSTTDASDRSLNNSFNTDNSVDNSTQDSHDYILTDTTGGDKRVNSNNYDIAGNVRNSNLGDFNQTYYGTDFRSGVQGSGNTIDTSSVNITTFGDTITKDKK
ncbi:MAG: hypothetical protein ABH859_07205 [Pseudomonadota bacterium]